MVLYRTFAMWECWRRGGGGKQSDVEEKEKELGERKGRVEGERRERKGE